MNTFGDEEDKAIVAQLDGEELIKSIGDLGKSVGVSDKINKATIADQEFK